MTPLLLATLVALHLQVQEAVRPVPSDTYLDASAEALHRSARERRERTDRSITRYQARVQERISLGLRALRRDRLFFRREVAAEVEWNRDGPVRIEVVGAREVLPAVIRDAQVPAGLEAYVPHLAFDPADPLLVGRDMGRLHNPFAPGSEAHYRFRSGDTTTVRLPGGRTVRLLELVVIPRAPDYRLLSGSFWIDADSHGVVQAVFRLARAWDRDRDGDGGLELAALLGPVRARIEQVTVEYGLWELKWWMPRAVVFEGVAEVGGSLAVPLRYELAYSGFVVEGDAAPLAAPAPAPEAAADTVRCRSAMVVRVGGGPDGAAGVEPADPAAADSAAKPRPGCERYHVTLADTATLLASDRLPADPFAQDEPLVPDERLAGLAAALGRIPGAPWQLGRPVLRWRPFGRPRYNRVEGLSLGAGVEMELGPVAAFGEARLGSADLEPNGELGVRRETEGGRLRVGAFRRLLPMDPQARPFSLGSSLGALLFGRDDADYYRSAGVELAGAPPAARAQRFTWRLFAQRESAAERGTDFSVARLLDEGRRFEPNPAADPADLVGAALALRLGEGQDPDGFRWGAELGLDAAAGDFEFARASLALRAAAPLPGALVGALELAGGASSGTLPLQHRWFVGGPWSVRGYDPGTRSGADFWRARAEIGTALPAARLVVFSDAGAAGPRRALLDDPLLSAGIGASLLDGLLRVDLARALRQPTGWRLTLHADAGM